MENKAPRCLGWSVPAALPKGTGWDWSGVQVRGPPSKDVSRSKPIPQTNTCTLAGQLPGVTHRGRAAGRGCRDPRASELNQREGDGQRVGGSQPGLRGAAKAAGPDADILCVDTVCW